jgi:hypothetical protein
MQRSPSNKTYSQAIKVLQGFGSKFANIKTRSADELASEISTTISELSLLGSTSVPYEELSFGEVPSSFRMNIFLEALSYDVNVLLDEMEILNANSIETHNFIKTELLRAQEENDILQSKIKTLQLYSSNEDSSILYFGDFFYTDEYIDWDLTSLSSRVNLWAGKYLSLGILEQDSLVSGSSSLYIEDGSNGIIGNNQQVTQIDPVVFSRETDSVSWENKLGYIIDQEPSSFMEFEAYQVSASDILRGKGYNFSYRLDQSEETSSYLRVLSEDNTIDWAIGPEGGELVLSLLLDLGEIHSLNNIQLVPYGLSDNSNPPIRISSIAISQDQSIWTQMLSKDLWVANGIDQGSLSIGNSDISIGKASVNVDSIGARFLQFKIHQSKPTKIDCGHFFYTKEDVAGERVEGPSPLVTNTAVEKDPASSIQNGLIKEREVFDALRWAIGIRDISVYSTKYKTTSSMISKKFQVPGGVDRVSLEADILLPSGYPTDTAWVRFFISPDDGLTWHQISRIEDKELGIPEIVAYNDSLPQELRLQGVEYYDLLDTPDSLRLKIEIDRETSNQGLSPIVKSYKVKVKRKTS